MAERLLVIGAGMAAAYLLEQLRAVEHQFDITVIGDESEACYNRVMLSGLLAGENTEGDLDLLQSVGVARKPVFLTGERVVELDLQCRKAGTNTGAQLYYDRLVLATGAQAVMPPFDGINAAGICVFRSLADARWLQERANGSRALVVGAGLLGLEAAHGLKQRDCDVAVLHRGTTIMNRQLDAGGARQLQADLETRGIGFILEETIASLDVRDGRLRGVSLSSGEQLAVDLLVFATGITPAAELARAAGVSCKRGILVNGRMQTDVAGVYALGECCQLGEQCFGLVEPIRQQAEVLCRELMAVPGAEFSARSYPTQLKISGVDIYSAGEVDCDTDEENLVFHDPVAGIYRRLVIRENRLAGAILVGDKRGGVWYSELILAGGDISGIRRGLMFGREVSTALYSAEAAA